MDLFGKVATKALAKRPKAQSKKAAASKNKPKKEPKNDVPAINNVFKATKGAARPSAKKASDANLVSIESKYTLQPQLRPNENASETIHVQKTRAPATPRTVSYTHL